MWRVTQYRCDPELTEVLVRNSRPTLAWMKSKGVKFEAMYGRQAHKVNGRFKFFGGKVCAFWGGGDGLIESLHEIAPKNGIRILYETGAVSLVEENGRKFIRHYLIDFGSTLGSASTGPNSPRSGNYLFSWKESAAEFLSAGLYIPRWARAHYPDLPAVGRFESQTFNPDTWVPEYRNPAFKNRAPRPT